MNDQMTPPAAPPRMAPKAVAALILAIASCPGGLAYGVPGIVLGAIGRHLSRQARIIFDANPGTYRGEKLIRAAEKWSRVGLIQGIIITVVSALFWTAYFVVLFGLIFSVGARHFGG
jgi:hypothetical protein